MLIRKIGNFSYIVHWRNTTNYSQFSTCIENSRFFLETIATERLEKVSMFLRKYRNSEAVALKELYNNSPIPTWHRKISIILRNDRDCKDVDL